MKNSSVSHETSQAQNIRDLEIIVTACNTAGLAGAQLVYDLLRDFEHSTEEEKREMLELLALRITGTA